MSKLILRPALAATAIVAALFAAGAAAESHAGQTYQIIKATDSRVWRLNTETGEIAVCSLDGEQLICTSSAQAITPPAKSYAELAAERERLEQREAQGGRAGKGGSGHDIRIRVPDFRAEARSVRITGPFVTTWSDE